MNYRHIYHAGNFMDVVKHVLLTALLNSLAKKETPYFYLDTHAGIGYYDLFSAMAKKTCEYENGIEKIIHASDPPAIIKQYLHCVHKLNNELSQARFASLRYYPGSPMIARALIRGRDRMALCELHPEEYRTLQHNFAGDKQVAVHHQDGFLGLKAFLPPQERRGLVLIDPPFESPDEFPRIAHSLSHAMKRWETGIYAIWYPIKEQAALAPFFRTLKENVSRPMLKVELTAYNELPGHVSGCGVIIINPPWQFDQTMDKTLPWLWKSLSINGQGAYSSSPLE